MFILHSWANPAIWPVHQFFRRGEFRLNEGSAALAGLVVYRNKFSGLFDFSFAFKLFCGVSKPAFPITRHMTNKLLVNIKSGDLFQNIYDATKEYYPDRRLTEKTVAFVEERCMEFLRPLSLERGSSLLERLAQHKESISEQAPQSPDQKKPKNKPER